MSIGSNVIPRGDCGCDNGTCFKSRSKVCNN